MSKSTPNVPAMSNSEVLTGTEVGGYRLLIVPVTFATFDPGKIGRLVMLLCQPLTWM
jgi:hypothetical protein